MRRPGSVKLVEEETALQVEIVRLEVLGGHDELVRVPAQPQLERIHDGARDLVLDREDVLELAVVGLGPEVVAVLHVDELRGDADPVADLAHAALEHRRHAELLADLPDVHLLPLEREATRCARRPATPGTLASALMISSVIPSLKYSFSGSALMLANGSTAIAFGAACSSGPPAACAAGRCRRRATMARSASANSAAVGKRSTGVRASARVTASSTASGTSRVARTLGIGETNRLAMIACGVGPVNGGSPVSIS